MMLSNASYIILVLYIEGQWEMLTADLIEHPGCVRPIKSFRKIIYGRLINVSFFQLIEMLPQKSVICNLK